MHATLKPSYSMQRSRKRQHQMHTTVHWVGKDVMCEQRPRKSFFSSSPLVSTDRSMNLVRYRLLRRAREGTKAVVRFSLGARYSCIELWSAQNVSARIPPCLPNSSCYFWWKFSSLAIIQKKRTRYQTSGVHGFLSIELLQHITNPKNPKNFFLSISRNDWKHHIVRSITLTFLFPYSFLLPLERTIANSWAVFPSYKQKMRKGSEICFGYSIEIANKTRLKGQSTAGFQLLLCWARD